ncbi:TBC1 domain family member 12 isoform X2 [Cuculus canorus]|uniref:TBC1 domain family member 12 isoform X2 n=1 Tax=Cuculus canorus TaxID=55661 RepID=UPI0023AA9130|nr:TBC1 domain family member 12 isoform X2 [Cuculus canorus]
MWFRRGERARRSGPASLWSLSGGKDGPGSGGRREPRPPRGPAPPRCAAGTPGAPQMVGPDDAGAPGSAAVLPAGRQEAAEEEEEEEEDGERDGSRGLSGGPGRRRLAAGGKRRPEKPPNGAACAAGPRGTMTNGDLGFPPVEEDAKLQNGGCLPSPPGPAGTALEEPLRSCRLRGEAEAVPGPRGGPPAFTDVNLNSRNTFEVSRRRAAPQHPPRTPEPAERARRASSAGGFAEFFARNFFTKRTKELKPAVQSAPGWKLFGKVPPRENLPKDSKIIQQEYEARTGRMYKPPPSSARRKNIEFEPLSTTALILEDRPANLPAKSVEEALRHRQEYDEMVAEAKKREIKEAHKRKKIMRERFKQEENIASAMVIWVNEILPNWEGMRATRRVRELWWQGLPPSVRGKVWSLAVGNELNITPELYEIFLSRAKERWKSFSETSSENDTEDAGASVADREASLELIKLDISRTFPSLYIFQKGGPYHDLLHSVLGAYTCYRPDVGYVQGMSFIAAVLILNLEEADAFIAFANLLNKPCQLAFFRVDHSMMLKYFAAFEVFFEENLPKLFLHFKSYSLTPDIYLIDWIFTLYSKSLPLDLACRVWDVFCRDGEEFLFRTGLGILRLYEDILLQMDFIHIAQFLTKLPEDITSEKLFSCIAAIQMQNSNKKWGQVFASLMKDNKEGDKNHSPALKS